MMRGTGRVAPLLGVILIGLALVSGCATTREDDYIASVLAEAMKESGVEAPPVVSTTPGGRQAALPVNGPSVVSVTPSGVVSAGSGGRVPTVQRGTTPVVMDTQPMATNPYVTSPEPRVISVEGAGSTASVSAASTTTPVPVEAVTPTVPADAMVSGTMTAPLKPAEPTIQPDTVLWISVAEDPSLNGRYVVNNSSAIDFGYVGLVFLQDMTATQAEAAIRNVLIGRYLNLATITVKIAKASYDVVGVLGNVEMPGEIKIGPGAAITLSEALRRASGLRSGRESNRVKIIRGGLRNPFGPVAEGELFSLVTEDGQMRVPAVYLRNNDLVYVFAAQAPSADGVVSTGGGGKRIVLLGEVPRRGVVEFGENDPCTLMFLLFKIGGLPRFAKGDRIQIVRRQKDGSEKTFIVDGDALMKSGNPDDDVILESGDRVVVPARKLSFF